MIIIFSYSLPLLFSLIFKPLLIERYIMYLIIPILLIISFYIFTLEKIFLRNSLIAIFIFLTFANFITEDTFKQTFQKIDKQKPDFYSAFSKIEKSNNKYFIVKKTLPKNKEKIKFNFYIDLALNKYVEQYISNNNFKLKLLSLDKIDFVNINEFWIICYKDVDTSQCEVPFEKDKYLVKDNIDFIRINLKKIYLR